LCLYYNALTARATPATVAVVGIALGNSGDAIRSIAAALCVGDRCVYRPTMASDRQPPRS